MIAYPAGAGTPWQIINVSSRDVLAALRVALLAERLPVLRLAVWPEIIETNNIATLSRERATRRR
jgi:hypothetical protein